MCDTAGRIWGLQIIRSTRHERRALAKEYWPKGLNKIGHFQLMGNPSAGGVLLIAEGYATAATLHERSEEHTSELPSLMRISYDVFCLKTKTKAIKTNKHR